MYTRGYRCAAIASGAAWKRYFVRYTLLQEVATLPCPGCADHTVGRGWCVCVPSSSGHNPFRIAFIYVVLFFFFIVVAILSLLLNRFCVVYSMFRIFCCAYAFVDVCRSSAQKDTTTTTTKNKRRRKIDREMQLENI